MMFPIQLVLKDRVAAALALADSAAGDRFIHPNYAKKERIPTRRLSTLIRAFNIDGTENKTRTITEYTELPVTIHGRMKKMRFYICGIGKHDIILGLPWFREENPNIDWKHATLSWSRRFLPLPSRKPHSPQQLPEPPPLTDQPPPTPPPSPPEMVEICVAYVDEDAEEPEALWINAKVTTSQLLAAEEYSKKPKKTVDEMLPEPYRQYRHLFEESEAKGLPDRRPWDHPIDLKPGFEPKQFKPYRLSPLEREELTKFIEENLKLGRIHPSQSPMSSPFFFIAKKNGKLRPCQDY